MKLSFNTYQREQIERFKYKQFLKKLIFPIISLGLLFMSDVPSEKLDFYRGDLRRMRIIKMLEDDKGKFLISDYFYKHHSKIEVLLTGISAHMIGDPDKFHSIKPWDLKRVLGEMRRGNYDSVKIKNDWYYVTCAKKWEGLEEGNISHLYFFKQKGRKDFGGKSFAIQIVTAYPDMEEMWDDLMEMFNYARKTNLGKYLDKEAWKVEKYSRSLNDVLKDKN